MGQTSTKKERVDLKSEADFLASRTDLTTEEVIHLFEEYSVKGKVSKKEFLQEFKRTFPRQVGNYKHALIMSIRALEPNAIASRVFRSCDDNHDGYITFR